MNTDLNELTVLFNTITNMSSPDTIANNLEISLFEIEDELQRVSLKNDAKRNALRVWQLWARSRKLFDDYIDSAYAQSRQWEQELRNFERRYRYVKWLIQNHGFFSHAF